MRRWRRSEELVRAGCTDDEIKHIVARVRADHWRLK